MPTREKFKSRMPTHTDGTVKGLSHVGPGVGLPPQLRLENKLKFFRFPILSSLVQALFISSLLPQVQTAVTRIRQFLRTRLGSRADLNCQFAPETVPVIGA